MTDRGLGQGMIKQENRAWGVAEGGVIGMGFVKTESVRERVQMMVCLGVQWESSAGQHGEAREVQLLADLNNRWQSRVSAS